MNDQIIVAVRRLVRTIRQHVPLLGNFGYRIPRPGRITHGRWLYRRLLEDIQDEQQELLTREQGGKGLPEIVRALRKADSVMRFVGKGSILHGFYNDLLDHPVCVWWLTKLSAEKQETRPVFDYWPVDDTLLSDLFSAAKAPVLPPSVVEDNAKKLMNERNLSDTRDLAISLVQTVETLRVLVICPSASGGPMRALLVQLFESLRTEFDVAQVKINAINRIIRQARGVDNPARIGPYIRDTYHEIALQLVLGLDRELFIAVSAAGLLTLEQIEEVRKNGLGPDIFANHLESIGNQLRRWECPDANEIVASIQLESAAAAELLDDKVAHKDGQPDGRTGNKATDTIDRLRRAIATKGKDAKPIAVIREAGIADRDGRELLRQLEKSGEYNGFARRKSPRWS